MIIACASDDGKSFVSRHFGDAQQYKIYEWSNNKFNYLKTITNTSEEENGHADPKKAKYIMEMLLKADVDVGLAKNFGPNIKRVKEKLVPVLVSTNEIEKGLAEVEKHFKEVLEATLLSENRIYVDLRQK
ncbi:MAG: NifB/NifX family molybdenum-iron cluster-binding protein [Gudongella sp.]|nr:NifB/NifX family molybdenum-iron cluster-binding protein [Gudongella sp.]